MLPRVHATIEGLTVGLEGGWAATAAQMRGYDRLDAVIPETDWRRVTGTQGSVVKLWTDAGEPLWEGRLASPPQITNGRAKLTANGHYVEADKKVDRLFIQSRDTSIWTPLDGEPFVNSNGGSAFFTSRKIDTSIGNRINLRIADQNIPSGNEDGVGFWVEGATLARIRFTMAYSTNDETTNLDVHLRRATGPTGAATGVTNFATSAGNNGTTKDVSIATPEDMVLLSLRCNTTFTPTSDQVYRLSRIVVNSSIETGDTYHAYQVASYIGGQLGWDTSGVVTSTYNVLPFDWDDGSWADAATYVAELEDKHWGVWDDPGAGPRMTYDSWGATEWTVYLAGGGRPDLQPLELFNTAHVWFETPSGVRRRRTATASPDPLAASGITNIIEYELNDRQSDATLATSVASSMLARHSRQRYAGKLDVVRAYDEAGRDNAYGIRPGDTVRVADWDMGESVTLRVFDVTYRENVVEVGVEQPVNIASLVAQAARRRRRRRGRNFTR